MRRLSEPQRFQDLSIQPALLRAIADRGYETATPVQAAVVDPALTGRDLLVSAPTGSGKTLAFGTLIADGLLAAPPAPHPAPPESGAAVSEEGPQAPATVPVARAAKQRGAVPRALVVAPTRELAAQVARELGWLFAGAEAAHGGLHRGHRRRRRSEAAAHRRGRRGRHARAAGRSAPARLAGRWRRSRSLVLDEADEMLDLGLPRGAGVPAGPGAGGAAHAAVLGDAAARDPEAGGHLPAQRRAGGSPSRGGGTAHADIRYVAHLVRARSPGGGDQRAAGRRATARRSCSVGRARGWASCTSGWWITASRRWRCRGSGRRAIATGRWRPCARGGPRVLVATNVAARGLDLPDVDLVIHADLPDNAESLTHRSGRTGRAGKKGTSMVIATPAERRKAERLLQRWAARSRARAGRRPRPRTRSGDRWRSRCWPRCSRRVQRATRRQRR